MCCFAKRIISRDEVGQEGTTLCRRILCCRVHAPFSYLGGTQPTVMLVGVADTNTGAPGGAEGGATLVQSRASRDGNPQPARVCAATRTCCNIFRDGRDFGGEVKSAGRRVF